MTDTTFGSAAGSTGPAVPPVPASPPAGQTLSPAGQPAPAVVEADAVAAAVLSCPEVSGLSGGQFGEVATYLPGRRVEGVRITTDTIDVHVVAAYGAPLHQIAARIRRTLVPLIAGLPVNITFDGITAD